jgi:hypothetical protein
MSLKTVLFILDNGALVVAMAEENSIGMMGVFMKDTGVAVRITYSLL